MPKKTDINVIVLSGSAQIIDFSGFEFVDHAPYSPALVPPDSHLISNMKTPW